MRFTRRVVTASLLAMALSAPAFADDKPLILLSVPAMSFPFFVHMMNDGLEVEAAKQGFSTIEGDGQDSSPKQTADIEAALAKGVKGIVISPREVDAMAPGLQEAVDANVPVVTIDRRVPTVTGVIGHVGADNVKGGEAQGNLIQKLFPDGATIINLQGTPGASPAIDRNKGMHSVLDKAPDKYKFVFEQTANFKRDDGLKVTESALAGMATPPQVIVAGNDDMALGAIEAAKGRNLKGIAIIGFDALPEALAKVRDGEMTATIEQFPAKQSSWAVDILADYLKSGKKPAQQVNLITPAAITKDNLKDAERLNEVK
ncbi:MAG: substrate-binding domain-containing protein [Hyphomicrobiales bacterium]|jgi:inositol transport system substrate-binding protein|nr:substrate-binding domain-containing protein [Hyphomicrobiales bacterium]